ncbi:MAG TPA: adenylate/guanylate cyclase domain-containing protein [Ilumatobacter sp.]
MSPVATQLVGSVLFTDLVGFTEYNDVCGDEAAVRVLDRQRAVLDATLRCHPGSRLVKELGDGLMIWNPDALGGLEVATGFAAAIQAARENEGFPLAVRLGLHHGPVIERGDDVVGQTVNVAARIAALAGPGELLVSDELLAACQGVRAGALAVGPVSVKGVADPVWLHRLA